MDATIVDRLAEANVLVVGDVLLDRFIEGRVTRISREAPVPVLKFGSARAVMGGACNVAANVLAFGGRATLVGLTGDDEPARELAALFGKFPGLSARVVADPARPTTVKTRYLSGWQQLLCIDSEDNSPAPTAIREKLVAEATTAMSDVDVVVISDYARGALDDTAIRALIAAARKLSKPVVADPRRADASVFAGATLVTPNIEEMLAFTGIRATSDETALAACRAMLDAVAIDAILLTRGSAGMTLLTRGASEALHVPAETHRVYDVTGAGDTVVAAIAAALGGGASVPEAVRLANTAAGIVVAKPGTATAEPQELRRALGWARGEGVLSAKEASRQVSQWQSLGITVGFTNGVFDLLHRGHLHSLEQARRRVDRLVVGANSDDSVRRLKGLDRPVQDEATRAALLAALRSVDMVVIFREDTPEELIQTLRPNRLFKGADYVGKDIPGAAFVIANGGSVELLPLLEGFSTSETVAKLKGV